MKRFICWCIGMGALALYVGGPLKTYGERVVVTCIVIYTTDGSRDCMDLTVSLPSFDILPKWDALMANIKTVDDLLKYQSSVVPTVETFTDTYLARQIELLQQGGPQFDKIDQLKAPSLDESGLRVFLPKLKYGSEMIEYVNQKIKQKNNQGLMLHESGVHNELMTRVFEVVLPQEKNTFEPYLEKQDEFNKSILPQAVAAATTAVQWDTEPLVSRSVLPQSAMDSRRAMGLDQKESLQLEVQGAPRLEELQNQFDKLVPVAPQAIAAKNIGLKAIGDAALAFQQGRSKESEFYYEVSVAMLDIVLGVVPVVGVGKDLYESIVGRSLLTDEPLTMNQRALALLGVVTAGLAPSVSSLSKVLAKISDEGVEIEKAVVKAAQIGSEVKTVGAPESEVVSALQDSLALDKTLDPVDILRSTKENVVEKMNHLDFKSERVLRVDSADRWNARFLESNSGGQIPYRPGTLVVTAQAAENSRGLARVYNVAANNMNSRWVVDKRILVDKGGDLLPASDIKNLLNLPKAPDRIVDVQVFKGEFLRFSDTGRNSFGNAEGVLQIELVRPKEINFINETIRELN